MPHVHEQSLWTNLNHKNSCNVFFIIASIFTKFKHEPNDNTTKFFHLPISSRFLCLQSVCISPAIFRRPFARV
ncbi:hypothetical protein ACE6H2_025845 [Prunus campanulata]